jgi:hypothetical protein
VRRLGGVLPRARSSGRPWKAPPAQVSNRVRRGLASALMLLCAAAPRLGMATPDAPLGVGTFGTLRMLFLDMPLAEARAGGDDLGLDVRWWMANDWSTPTTLTRDGHKVQLQTDEQSDVLAVAIRLPWSRLLGVVPGTVGDRPLPSRLATTLELRLDEHWGGWSDGLIEWWHGLIGSTNFERGRYPRNAVNLTLREPGGTTVFALTSPRLAVGDIAVRTQFLLAEGGASFQSPDRSRWGLSLRADVKVPIASLDSLGGSGGWDAGLGLAASGEIASWLTGHAMVTASAWSGLPASFPLQPRTWHWSAEFSLAARVWGLTLLLEDRVVSPLFEDGWSWVPGTSSLNSSATYAVLRTQNQISWGIRRGGFTLWMCEDWTPGSNPGGRVHWFYNSNEPDFVLGITYATSL